MVWASHCSFKGGDKLPDGPTPKACFAESPSDRKCRPVVPYLRASAISPTKPHHRNRARSQGVLQTQPQLHRDGAGRPNRGRGWGESLIHRKTSRRLRTILRGQLPGARRELTATLVMHTCKCTRNVSTDILSCSLPLSWEVGGGDTVLPPCP